MQAKPTDKTLVVTLISVGVGLAALIISLSGFTIYLVGDVGDRITRLEQRMNARFDQVDQRLDKVEERVGQVEQRMGRLEGWAFGLTPPKKKRQ